VVSVIGVFFFFFFFCDTITVNVLDNQYEPVWFLYNVYIFMLLSIHN